MDQGPSGAPGARDAHSLPGCYRHPDRETGISCVRCERPICPECMVSASVGFQCPDCVRGGSGTGSFAVNAPRTIAGGTITADPRLLTKILLGINAAVFLAVLVMDEEFAARYLMLVGAFPPPELGWEPVMGVAAGEWYRLVTSMFTHQKFLHLASNMLLLWWLGGPLEAALGRARYLALYLVSGLAGSALTYVIAAPGQFSLGASGAVFGLMGATVVLMRRLNQDLRPVLVLVALNLVFTVLAPRISWEAHVGGLVAGAIIGYAMVHAPRGRRALIQWGTCGAVLVVVLVMIVVRTMALT
ncbi:rhomboid family intramembrane serine protease [Streptomyces albidoflavus]|uniref:rhomboid family intramembrane serine protease n=1 Tax=Streptomyces albidoflavus TaxID=1886 RepID=UPI00101E8087|nr:rhomboid family intramembrane serine protease [Streptomyces albidoflavus]RZE63753.1 rhomboid family intramembrane serine protease [Streptomyces albidoflavus]RZE76304.1 rhomboid family intramembrane serine protease [Streptomyces albidoflavus]